MYFIEEGPMAISLMFALLDVADAAALAAAPPFSPAGLYRQCTPNQRRRVRAAVYEAFYSILEAQKIDYMGGPPPGRGTLASNGVAGALARVISSDLSAWSAAEIQHLTALEGVLREALNRAVNEELVP
jgi:hypothetical protein